MKAKDKILTKLRISVFYELMLKKFANALELKIFVCLYL